VNWLSILKHTGFPCGVKARNTRSIPTEIGPSPSKGTADSTELPPTNFASRQEWPQSSEVEAKAVSAADTRNPHIPRIPSLEISTTSADAADAF